MIHIHTTIFIVSATTTAVVVMYWLPIGMMPHSTTVNYNIICNTTIILSGGTRLYSKMSPLTTMEIFSDYLKRNFLTTDCIGNAEEVTLTTYYYIYTENYDFRTKGNAHGTVVAGIYYPTLNHDKIPLWLVEFVAMIVYGNINITSLFLNTTFY